MASNRNNLRFVFLTSSRYIKLLQAERSVRRLYMLNKQPGTTQEKKATNPAAFQLRYQSETLAETSVYLLFIQTAI